MSRSTLELTDLIGDKVAFGAYKAERLGDNSRSLEKMRQYMYSVIRTELTEQQRKCIMLLITEGKSRKRSRRSSVLTSPQFPVISPPPEENSSAVQNCLILYNIFIKQYKYAVSLKGVFRSSL